MISRSFHRSGPIPFADPLHEPQDQPSRAVRWSPPSPQMGVSGLTPATLRLPRSSAALHSANDARRLSAVVRPAVQAVVKAPAERKAANRLAQARYDGPQSVSVRSSATGRYYRFEHPGHVLTIDADDVMLMRRIQDITLL